MKRVKALRMVSTFSILFFTVCFSVSLLALIFVYNPGLAYSLDKGAYDREVTQLTVEPKDFDAIVTTTAEDDFYVPDVDPTLSEYNILTISKIGVETEIFQTADSEAGLNQGAWLVDFMGTPFDQSSPTVISSHRWGAIDWNEAERATKSFNRLPEMAAGDTVEIVWNQRKYTYTVTVVEETTAITDHSADLILYTCKYFLPSQVRLVLYANLIKE